jgi:hypothetical protein
MQHVADFGPLAQLVEQWTFNPLVVGSNPTRPTNKSTTYLILAVPGSCRCVIPV